jgi:hypothetical protein
MALEQIGFIPVSPVARTEAERKKEWRGEYWPALLRSTKLQAAREWFARQRWDAVTHNEFYHSSDQVLWCEMIGVTFKTVFMGELPNAHQS